MASIVGNKQRDCEHTLDIKYAALMKTEQGVANKDVCKKFNVPKNPLSMWKKNRDKIVAVFKSSGGTKRQRINEGIYVQANLACFKWLVGGGTEGEFDLIVSCLFVLLSLGVSCPVSF